MYLVWMVFALCIYLEQNYFVALVVLLKIDYGHQTIVEAKPYRALYVLCVKEND